MRRKRVLIVEDSAVVREHLKRMIGSDSRLEVAGAVSSGEEAIEVLERLAPDVISMDVQLPGISGLEATRAIMSRRPTPIVVVSGIEAAEMSLTMEALKAGALSVIEKPPAATQAGYEAVASRLCTRLAIMSEVAVIRQQPHLSRDASIQGACENPGRYRVVGIAASTGGPNALMRVLSGLGSGFPLPILVVQHMESSFVTGFGEWLANATGRRLELVDQRRELIPGAIFLAAPDRHIALDGAGACPYDGGRVGNQRPSASVLFSSIARHAGPAGIGVVLTGMGDDGAKGLRELREAGGYTVAEHESTAVVYGMPAAAIESGAACESLPLPEVAPRLAALAGRRGQNT